MANASFMWFDSLPISLLFSTIAEGTKNLGEGFPNPKGANISISFIRLGEMFSVVICPS